MTPLAAFEVANESVKPVFAQRTNVQVLEDECDLRAACTRSLVDEMCRERISEALPSSMKDSLDGTGTKPEDLCRAGLADAADIAEHEHVALHRRQLHDRAVDLLPGGVEFQCVLRSAAAITVKNIKQIRVLVGGVHRSPAAASTEFVDAEVERDPLHPCADVESMIDPVDARQDTEVGLLQQVVNGRGVVDVSATKSAESQVMSTDKSAKGTRVTREVGL